MKLASEIGQLVERLERAGHVVDSVVAMPNNFGWKLRLETGEYVTRFVNGTVMVQGRDPAPVCKLLGVRVPRSTVRASSIKSEPRS